MHENNQDNTEKKKNIKKRFTLLSIKHIRKPYNSMV